ncbi:MAG TPA: MFS transporter [Pirellulaceae bacterium]|nr:MFS transporter [Pirellulaceae bacterium]
MQNSAARSYWPVVILLMLVVGLGHFNRVGMSVAGTERIIPEYKIAPDQMGLVYSAFLLFYTLAMLPGGWFIDRFGARAALAAYGFASAAFVALTGCVGLLWDDARGVWLGLIAVRSLMGVVNAPLHPASARMVYGHVPAGAKSLANGLVTFAACVGIAGTFYILGPLIDRWDWPRAFLITSVFTAAVACVWLVGTRYATAAPAGGGKLEMAAPRLSELWPLLGRRSVICITLSYAAMGFFQYLFFYWIEYYFETVQKQGVDVARQYSALTTLAMGAGMVCGGWLADKVPAAFGPRIRRRLVPMLGMIASGVVFELGLLSPDIRVTLAAFALAAALLGATEGAFWTTVVELGGRFGGTAAGLMNTGGNAGGTLSPYVTPLLSTYFAAQFGEELGWRLGLSVAGAVSILGALLWCGVDPGRDAAEA